MKLANNPVEGGPDWAGPSLGIADVGNFILGGRHGRIGSVRYGLSFAGGDFRIYKDAKKAAKEVTLTYGQILS